MIVDKGRVIFFVDKTQHNEKIIVHLQDTLTCEQIKACPDITNQCNNDGYPSAGENTERESLKMEAKECNIAKFYGLPKIYKQDITLRPIVHIQDHRHIDSQSIYGTN